MKDIDVQMTLETESEVYKEFVEKFKPKKTTDDCYTPANIYNAVLAYVCDRWGVNPDNVVRPFYPGGDYEHFEYFEGCVVVDNPPFSILAKIRRYYIEREIPYFLFAPALMCIAGGGVDCAIVSNTDITYENGAVVHTAFVTNMEKDNVLESSPQLYEVLNEINRQNLREGKKEMPKYEYPFCVCTSAMITKYSRYGVEYQLKRSDVDYIRALDSMREQKKSLFGGGFLLTERAAAERAAAERAAAERAAAERAAAERAAATTWELSDRERSMQELIEKRRKNEKR